MTDFGALITRSEGRLTEDQAFVLTHVSHYGSDGYPVRKTGNHWAWGPIRGISGPPTTFRTKREATASFEAYLDVLRDKLAGRGDWV
jgi:hypothetical protein